MSDTQKLILWIVLAVIVILIVAWLLVRSSRKRKEEEQRRQARSLRAKAAQRTGGVTRASDRASVTQQIASDARADADRSHAQAQQALEEAKARAAEAEQKAARAEQLDQTARTHQSTAAQVQSDRDDLLREADRVDPDVETDEQGRQLGESDRSDDAPVESDRSDDATGESDQSDDATGEHLGDPTDDGPGDGGSEREAADRSSTWPGAVGVGSAAGAVAAGGISSAAFEDDDPDLADADNPFAPPQTHGLESEEGGHGLHEGSGERDRSEEARDDDVMRDADAGAGDTRGTTPVAPVAGEGDKSSGGRTEPSGATGPADPRDRPAGEVFASRPEFGDPAGTGRGTKVDEQDEDFEDDADWVNGPVDEDAVDDRPADDVVDWINGPNDDESVTMDVPDEGSTSNNGLVAAAAVGGARGGPDAPSAPAQEVVGRMPEQPHAATPEQDDTTHGDQKSEEEQANVESAGSDHSGDRGGDADTDEPDHSASDRADDARSPDSASDDEGQHLGRQSDSDTASEGRRQRRVSELGEVRDGGHGVGSAAPIEDGAQPLGHAIKGVRGSGTYLSPDSQGYDDVEPDVWFYDEESARNAGYRSSADD